MREKNSDIDLKDELVNSSLHQHLDWQLVVLDLFKKVDYEIISLNTAEQLKDNAASFTTLMEKLGCSNELLKDNQSAHVKQNPSLVEEDSK